MDEKNQGPIAEKIVQRIIEDEMKQSYLAYSMSVIVGRALPDVRDGLKPVHRRVLYAMYDMGMLHNKPFKKSARIVGEVLGKYHPHGDVAVYDTMVRLAQDFSLRYPLVQGQGNWGCFTKDTQVALSDGRNLGFGALIEEHTKGNKNYTYTINKEGHVEIAEIKNPRLTIENAEIMKVILDNGEEIKCTLNHKFMLRDGTYKEAKDLRPGESLMPLYTRLSDETDTFKPGLSRFFGNDMGKLHEILAVNTAKLNHKVKEILFLNQREDVYDLTIDVTHNFALAGGIFVHNSIDGDNAAAMRYTEARLNKLSEEILQDLDKETVDFTPNFDASLKEPTVLPSKVPNLLVNGSSGIAVGMATNIPPHNMAEVVDGIISQIDNPEITADELMKYVKGPDFPTGASICGMHGIRSAYKTGKGKMLVRSKTKIEQGKRQKIIVTEIPYMVNKASLVEEIADMVRDKKVLGINDIRDESDRDGIRVVIELKQDYDPNVVLNQLYQHTRMQVTFGVIMLALVNSRPEILTLKGLIQNYIVHRQIVVRRKTQFEMVNAQKRSHILEGLIIALNSIDSAIRLIKQSKSAELARVALMTSFTLSIEQANAILDMKLQRLTSLEQEKIRQEQKDLVKLIEELKSILASEPKILGIIKRELAELKQHYGDQRRTEILDIETEEMQTEDLIEDEDMAITITHSGYIKRLSLDTYKQQRRGGKGIIAAGTKEQDYVEDIFVAAAHSHLMFFTNKGKVHWLKVHEIPEASRQAQGKAIVNLLSLEQGEKITAFVPVREFLPGHFVVMATKRGIIKKTSLQEFSNPRRGGIRACTLHDDDALVSVRLTSGKDYLIIGTKHGLAVHFHEEAIRDMGRSAAGVIGIRLQEDDDVIGMVVVEKGKTLLTVTENGHGKRTPIEEYRETNRGAKGVINIKTKFLYEDSKNSSVVSIVPVSEDDEVMFITHQGIAIRTPAKGISVVGRSTQGIRLMKLEENDRVVSATKIVTEQKEESLELDAKKDDKGALGFEPEPVELNHKEQLIMPVDEPDNEDPSYAVKMDPSRRRYEEVKAIEELFKKNRQNKPI